MTLSSGEARETERSARLARSSRQGGTRRRGSCSTEYVRGREARRLELSFLVGIANRDKECTLREGGMVDEWPAF